MFHSCCLLLAFYNTLSGPPVYKEERCLIFRAVCSLVYLIEWESPCITPHWFVLREREPKAEVTGGRAKPPFEWLNYIQQQQVFQLSRVDAGATLLFKFPDETQGCLYIGIDLCRHNVA